MRELYLVIAYDTPDDRRRARLAKLLKGFGERRQYSVFEARLTREQWAHLKGKLEALVNKEEDVLAVYFLPPEAVGRTWRIGHEGLKRPRTPTSSSEREGHLMQTPCAKPGVFAVQKAALLNCILVLSPRARAHSSWRRKVPL